MNKEFKHYIIPLAEHVEDCVGFFVNDLFITAGHNFRNVSEKVIYFNKKNHILKKEAALLMHDTTDDTSNEYSDDWTTQLDIAVFRLDGVNSPLQLADSFPEIGQELISHSFLREFIPAPQEWNIFNRKTIDVLNSQVCTANVEEIQDYYFSCKTSVVLKPGTSGSPVLSGNKVYGVLHGGIPGEPTAVFLSSKIIFDLLKKKQIL